MRAPLNPLVLQGDNISGTIRIVDPLVSCTAVSNFPQRPSDTGVGSNGVPPRRPPPFPSFRRLSAGFGPSRAPPCPARQYRCRVDRCFSSLTAPPFYFSTPPARHSSATCLRDPPSWTKLYCESSAFLVAGILHTPVIYAGPSPTPFPSSLRLHVPACNEC